MSYKCIATVRIGHKRTIKQGNDLRFPTKKDAKAFCAMLCDPPHVVKGWTIKEVPGPANYCMKDGILKPL